MTPGNIVGMSLLNGLQIVALTDHNSTKNCPAFFKIAKKHGIIPIAGMELTTAEDIHVICLFRSLEAAMAFGDFVDEKRIGIPNKTEIFGRQLILDENDLIVGEEPNLLINAVDLSLEEAFNQVHMRDGVCYPAHIDRSANGMVAVLGDFPPEPAFTAFELNDLASLEDCVERLSLLRQRELVHVASSDAHYLTDISEEGFSIDLQDEPYSSDRVRNNLIDYLLGKEKGGNKNG